MGVKCWTDFFGHVPDPIRPNTKNESLKENEAYFTFSPARRKHTRTGGLASLATRLVRLAAPATWSSTHSSGMGRPLVSGKNGNTRTPSK